MQKLLLATNNRDKVLELKKALADLHVHVLSAADFPDAPEVIEDASSLKGNAIKKALTLYRHTRLPAIADDTGLEVEALGGAPGIYSSRYAGENASYADNVQKLLREMRNVPEAERGARFRTVIAFANERGIRTVEGICTGRITTKPRGENYFGYDPVFFVPELGKTMAEMSLEEKNSISHRGRAMAEMLSLLREYFQTTMAQS